MTEGNFGVEFKNRTVRGYPELRAFVEFGLVTKVDATKWFFPLVLILQRDFTQLTQLGDSLPRWEIYAAWFRRRQ
jgi:hypothetical protein